MFYSGKCPAISAHSIPSLSFSHTDSAFSSEVYGLYSLKYELNAFRLALG